MKLEDLTPRNWQWWPLFFVTIPLWVPMLAIMLLPPWGPVRMANTR